MSLPVDFMERLAQTYGDPSAFSELVFGSPLHSGQRRYTGNATADTNFLLPGNSFGKTELIARFVTYLCWFKDGPYRPESFKDWIAQEYKALVASYNYDIAEESFDRLQGYHRNREEFNVLVKSITVAPHGEIQLVNGSVISWGSLKDGGKGVEAARRRVIFVDEAGHIPDLSSVFDDILFPRTMGVGGRIHLFGTPKAHSDPYLLEVYEKGKPGPKKDPFYYSQDGTSLENEFWPENEKARALANPRFVTGWRPCPDLTTCEDLLCRDGMHPILTAKGRQAIRGEFTNAGGYFFKRPAVARMFTGVDDVERDGDNHFHVGGEWSLGDDGFMVPTSAYPKDRLYLAAYDLGGNKMRRRKKKGSDATVGFVLDYTERPWRVVCFDYVEGGDMDWEQKYKLMASRFHAFPMPYLLIDATGQIDSVTEALQARGVEVNGINFGGNSNKKFDMLRNLQLCLEMEFSGSKGVLRSPPIERLKHELDHYVLPDDDIEQDCVFALGMVTHEIAQWELPMPVNGEVY